MIRVALSHDAGVLAALRHALWPDSPVEEHLEELRSALASAGDNSVVLVAVEGERLHGFAEAALRLDPVNGCESSPVAFLEGIYVRPEARGGGVGRALVLAVEGWGRERGCTELASDALLENAAGQSFHGAVGFKETERVVYFRKRL